MPSSRVRSFAYWRADHGGPVDSLPLDTDRHLRAPGNGLLDRGLGAGVLFAAASGGYRTAVAILNLLIDRPPGAVWKVIRDGYSYARWVAGTQEIREVDDDWPAVGSKIHFTAGLGPLKFDDVTYVRRLEEHSIDLQAYAGNLGSARVSIEVKQWGRAQTLVIIDEHPLTGAPARWHNGFVELLLRARNRRMAAALKQVVEDPEVTSRTGP